MSDSDEDPADHKSDEDNRKCDSQDFLDLSPTLL